MKTNHLLPPILKTGLALGLIVGLATSVLANNDPYTEAAASIGSSLDGIKPNDPKAAWFREAKYGMFVNWGLYSIPAGEWNGKSYTFAEFISCKMRIPAAEYAKIADQFNPKRFDAESWVKLAKEAGMKYLVFDAKHHDGFAMYRSKVSPFNVYDATPWKRDPAAELQAACAKHGIKLCFYYSHSADWHEPDGGGYNDWDFQTDTKTRDFDSYLTRKSIPQVRELLSNYGEIGYLWFDWPGPFMTPERAQRVADAVHCVQPNTLINSRLGPKEPKKVQGLKKVAWDFKSMGDNQVPPAVLPGVWETAATLNTAWGYTKKEKDKARSAAEICFALVDVVSKGGNYLLNVGPDADGVIPNPQEKTLREVGAWLKANGEAVYGAGPTPFGAELGAVVPDKLDKNGKPLVEEKKHWRCTTKPGKLYIHLFKWPENGQLELAGVKGNIRKAGFLAENGAGSISIKQQGETVKVTLPAQAPEGSLATVLVLEKSE